MTLVGRLRTRSYANVHDVLGEAADHIERLESEYRELVEEIRAFALDYGNDWDRAMSRGGWPLLASLIPEEPNQ